jgi:hypothetical protein
MLTSRIFATHRHRLSRITVRHRGATLQSLALCNQKKSSKKDFCFAPISIATNIFSPNAKVGSNANYPKSSDERCLAEPTPGPFALRWLRDRRGSLRSADPARQQRRANISSALRAPVSASRGEVQSYFGHQGVSVYCPAQRGVNRVAPIGKPGSGGAVL